jgi:hypothetical protein
VQLAKAIGVRVATTIASSAAAALASSLGADETINYRDEKVEAYVDRLTAGHGFDVVSTRSVGTIFSRPSPLPPRPAGWRHGIVNPLQLLAGELRRPFEQRLRFQAVPATPPVPGEPSLHRTPADDPQGLRTNLGAFASRGVAFVRPQHGPG